MKKMMILAMMMVMTVTANAMSYTTARNEALFLSDKMAYELNLTDAQYNAVYEINLDYLLSMNGHDDIFGIWWSRRNADLRYVLTPWQYDRYVALTYFYRPLSWKAGAWTFHIYNHYANRSLFYKARPTVYVSYRGGNNHKSAHFYANHGVTKPHHNNHGHKPAGNGPTWRGNGGGGAHHNATVKPNGRPNGSRTMAHNTNPGRSNGHFGGHR